MKTQNTPATHSDILFTHIVNTLVDLAKHEGTLMTFEGLLRNGIEVDEGMMDSMLGVSQDSAAQCVVQLRDCGAITSPAVYEMVTHVEQLAMRLAPDWWKQIVPWSVQPLRYYQEEARAKRERFIVCQRERQYPFNRRACPHHHRQKHDFKGVGLIMSNLTAKLPHLGRHGWGIRNLNVSYILVVIAIAFYHF